jgi:hypothetical protein
LKHPNISIRIPTDHAGLVVDAAKGSKTLLSRWAADRLVKAAAAELGVPVPAPAAPTRDQVRQAAKAMGMTEDAFRARVLAEACTIALSATLSVGDRKVEVPAKKPSESGEFRIATPKVTTPAAEVRAAIGRVTQ